MKNFLSILLLIVVCLLFFYPAFTKGLIPVPTDTLVGLYHPWFDLYAANNPNGIPYKNFLITDPIRQQIPWRKLVVDSLKKGEFPNWNPYNFSGTPIAANIQAGTFYPLNILFLFLPFISGWTALIIIQPILAALFLYWYLRNKKIAPLVAMMGGISWAFCGFSIAWLTWGTIVQTALWLPLILLAIDKIVETNKRLVWSLILSASVSFAFFAGHAQIALYVFLFAAVYSIFRFSKWLFLVGAFVLIITSIQWMPMLVLLNHSSRLFDSTVWIKDGWFLPWQNLAQFIAPDFFGNPATLNYTGIWNYGEFIGYIGVLPLIFACYALLVRRDWLTRFFGIGLGVVFLFLLPTPVAKLPYQLHIPFWETLQPTRLMVLVDFCLVILATLGIDHFIRTPCKKIFFVAAFMGAAIAGLWMVNNDVSRHNMVLPSGLWLVSGLLILLLFFLPKKFKNVGVYCFIVLITFDLFRFGWKFIPFTPRKYFFPTTQAISFLANQQKPFRVMSLDNRAIPPNVLAYYGIESPEGYDPVYDARYEEFIAALNRNQPNIAPPFGFNRIITISNIDSPLLPLLNVKYIITLEDTRNPTLELMYREGNTRIYFYTKALPRQYAVRALIIGKSKQQIINILYGKEFNPLLSAVVEEPISIPSGGHFEVISQTFDSGWKAYIDGKETRIYRTNYIFQGVVVPQGRHSISLRYN